MTPLKSIRWPNQSGVYFVQAGTNPRVKIGTSKNVRKKLSELQDLVDNVGADFKLRLLALISGGRSEELRMHEMFKSSRIWPGREWFWLRGELLSFLRTGKMPDDLLPPPKRTWLKSFRSQVHRQPFAMRFRPKELDIVKDAALADNVKPTIWIRNAALSVAESGDSVRFVRAPRGDLGVIVAVRFSPIEMRRVIRVVSKTELSVSAWVRLCAVELAKKRLSVAELNDLQAR